MCRYLYKFIYIYTQNETTIILIFRHHIILKINSNVKFSISSKVLLSNLIVLEQRKEENLTKKRVISRLFFSSFFFKNINQHQITSHRK